MTLNHIKLWSNIINRYKLEAVNSQQFCLRYHTARYPHRCSLTTLQLADDPTSLTTETREFIYLDKCSYISIIALDGSR